MCTHVAEKRKSGNVIVGYLKIDAREVEIMADLTARILPL
jgi:hypothetical protein